MAASFQKGRDFNNLLTGLARQSLAGEHKSGRFAPLQPQGERPVAKRMRTHRPSGGSVLIDFALTSPTRLQTLANNWLISL